MTDKTFFVREKGKVTQTKNYHKVEIKNKDLDIFGTVYIPQDLFGEIPKVVGVVVTDLKHTKIKD